MKRVGTVSSLLLRPVVAAILRGGLPLEAFYRATHLTPAVLADVDARVTPDVFRLAWAELLRLTGDPAVALVIAAETPPGSFGIVEYVCRSAPTVAEALRQWIRYLNLLNDAVEVGLVEEGAHVALRVLSESDTPAPASHELCFALVAAQARALAPASFHVAAVAFTHRLVGEAGVYERFFCAPVRFSSLTTELVMPRRALDEKLTTADPSLHAILTRHAAELAERDRSTSPALVAEVKRLIRESLKDDDAHIEAVAERMGVTARSLQRRLKEEGSSFHAVREEVRRDLAARYLEGDLSIAEISFLLGFSEPSAFFRAYKRWTGKTPLESRSRRGASM